MNLQVEIRCRLVGALGTLEIPGLVVNNVDVSPQVVLLSEGLVTLVAEVGGAFLPATKEYGIMHRRQSKKTLAAFYYRVARPTCYKTFS
jgi:hypothetical protein